MTIKAKIIADSISSDVRITTMELNYPRFIHSEFMTHRMFSRNASSSRAIPIEKMIASVEASPAMPIHWGKNQPGMQARGEIEFPELAKGTWEWASNLAVDRAYDLLDLGLHKQVTNRLLEPFQWIKVIVTATEYTNFFKLRMHPDAQPEMYKLAEAMGEAMDNSIPTELSHGEWHLPYMHDGMDVFTSLSLEDEIKCSVARCARVSYLNHDASVPDVSKDIALADMLLSSGHMSPFEHQATPMKYSNSSRTLYGRHWEEGVIHMDRNGDFWSGNFRGWIQNRNLI